MMKLCTDCTFCTPITKAGLVTSFGEIIPEKYLFDKWGEPKFCTCAKIKKPWTGVVHSECENYEPRTITVKDLRWWMYMLPLRWKDKDTINNPYLTLDISATEDRLEVVFRHGTIAKDWVFSVGDKVESVSDMIHTIDLDRYNSARIAAFNDTPDRQFSSYGKCDKEIGGDGINPYYQR